MRQIIRDTLESISVFCLAVIRWIPKSTFLRIPAWLGIPLVINAVVALICIVATVAKPFFKEVFGAGQDKTKK